MLDMVGAMRSLENVDETNTEEWLQSDACEPGLQDMMHMDIINALQNKREKRLGRMRVKLKEKVCVTITG
jgi:hypothetical protein